MSFDYMSPWSMERTEGVLLEWHIHDASGLFVVAAQFEPVARLVAAAPELLASCKELRDAIAAAFRVMESDAAAWGRFEAEMAKLGIAPGIGVRAREAIEKAEGGCQVSEPTIADAKELAMKYRKVGVLILFFGDGQYGTASYGMTRHHCDAMRQVSDQICDQIGVESITIPAVLAEGGGR